MLVYDAKIENANYYALSASCTLRELIKLINAEFIFADEGSKKRILRS